MAGLKTTEANAILDSQLGGTVYLALYTVAPTASSAGTEVSGGSYARQSFTFNTAASGVKTSSATINFPTATAAWGTIVAWAVMSASSGGTQKTFKTITSVTVNNGDQITIPAGNISVTLS